MRVIVSHHDQAQGDLSDEKVTTITAVRFKTRFDGSAFGSILALLPSTLSPIMTGMSTEVQ